MQPAIEFIQKNINLSFFHITLSDSMVKTGGIVVLIFFFLILMAKYRRHYVDWSLKGGVFGVFFGFLFALILEGFLIIGGKTALTEILGWKNPPTFIGQALDAGKSQLVQVLGIKDQIPVSNAENLTTANGVVSSFQSLAPREAAKVKAIICAP